MLDSVTDWLLSISRVVPLEVFTFTGSFIEELIAPIPSPIVMTLTGSMAAAAERPMIYLLVLSLIAALGKTIGAVLVYVITDKAENLILGKFGRFVGVTHGEIEALGKRFKGGWRDLFLLFILRALPIMSSAVVSICSGAIKIPMRTYIPATLLGTIVRDFFYLYVGYTGIETLHRMVEGFDSIESMIQTGIGILIVVIFGWIVFKRRSKRKPGETAGTA